MTLGTANAELESDAVVSPWVPAPRAGGGRVVF
jgi:hypothetical protein